MSLNSSFILNSDLKDFQNDEGSYLNFPTNEINHKNEDNFLLDNCETGITNQKKEVNIDNNNKSETNFIGKKKNNSNKKEFNRKYDGDNIKKKIKSSLLSYLLSFINSIINNKYNGNIGHGASINQLAKIDNQKLSSKDDKQILKKTLKEIFSEIAISKANLKLNNENYNRDLIQKLLNEEDEEKRVFFNKLFNLTFIECLKHFRGSEIIEELNGLASLDDFLKKFKDDPEYQENVIYYIFHFEEVIGRKRNKKEKNKLIAK
jgi:hypothetical protein